MKINTKLSAMLLALMVLLGTPLYAAVSVTGAAGEDADGLPPFQTVNKAIDYAKANNDPVVSLDTNTTLSMINYTGGGWVDGFTIKAGAGFTPTIAEPCWLWNQTTNTTQIVLEGIKFIPPADHPLGDRVLCLSGNTLIRNCTFASTKLNAAHTMDFANTPPSVGRTVRFENCTLENRDGGRVMYVANGSNIILDNCRLRGGMPHVGVYMVVGDDTSTIMNRTVIEPVDMSLSVFMANTGTPFTATNCLFLYKQAPGWLGADGTVWFANSQENVSFQHCTFRSVGPVTKPCAGIIFQAGDHFSSTFNVSNCLFDSPTTNSYGIRTLRATDTAQGDGNAYNLPAANVFSREVSTTQTTQLTSFETTKYVSDSINGNYATDASGRLTIFARMPEFVSERGVALTPAVTVDFEGQARPQGNGPDIGADEWAMVPVELSDFSAE